MAILGWILLALLIVDTELLNGKLLMRILYEII